MTWDLRIELFVDDLARFADFYTRVLGFTVASDRHDSDVPYQSVRRDGVRFGAVLAGQPVDPAARAFPASASRTGLGDSPGDGGVLTAAGLRSMPPAPDQLGVAPRFRPAYFPWAPSPATRALRE